jgi:hypothetical protein
MQVEVAADPARLEALAMERVSLCLRSIFPLYNLMSLSWAVSIRRVAPCIQAMVRFVIKESYITLVLDDILLVCFPMGTPNRVDYK